MAPFMQEYRVTDNAKTIISTFIGKITVVVDMLS